MFLEDISLATKRIPAVCGSCELGCVCLCTSLPAAERSKLIEQVVRPTRIRAGDHIYRAGEPFQWIYAIKTGHVKTYAQNGSGEERIVGFPMAGDTLGLEALHERYHNVSSVALIDTTACRISVRAFERFATEISGMQRQLLLTLSRDIARHHQWLITENQRAERRVAAFLIRIADKQKARGEDPEKILLPMSRADIGSYLNLAHETVTRALSCIAKTGSIRTKRRKIDIDDIEQLREQAFDPDYHFG